MLFSNAGPQGGSRRFSMGINSAVQTSFLPIKRSGGPHLSVSESCKSTSDRNEH